MINNEKQNVVTMISSTNTVFILFSAHAPIDFLFISAKYVHKHLQRLVFRYTSPSESMKYLRRCILKLFNQNILQRFH